MDINSWKHINIGDIDSLPSNVWACYAFIVDEAVMYIGRSKSLWTRIRNHKILKQLSLDNTAVTIAISADDYDNEKALILQYKPPLNIDYICKYPQIHTAT